MTQVLYKLLPRQWDRADIVVLPAGTVSGSGTRVIVNARR